MSKKLFLVSQPRIRYVSYERKVWADSPAEAIALAADGTSWPESYDEVTLSVEESPATAVDITDPEALKQLVEY